MTNEDIITGMLTITEATGVEPGFLNNVLDHIATLSPEGFRAMATALKNAAGATTDEPRRVSLQILNRTVAKDQRFIDAIERFHTWETAQKTPTVEAPPVVYPPSPGGVLPLDEKTRRDLEKKGAR